MPAVLSCLIFLFSRCFLFLCLEFPLNVAETCTNILEVEVCILIIESCLLPSDTFCLSRFRSPCSCDVLSFAYLFFFLSIFVGIQIKYLLFLIFI